MLSSIQQPLREDLDSEARKNCVNICRTNILDGALRAFKRNSFNPRAQMDVKFVTGNANLELGMDNGGPKREFFRLVVSELRGLHIFSRPRAQICFCATSLDQGLYRWAGQIFSYILLHGDYFPSFLDEKEYNALLGAPNPGYTIDDIMDASLRELCQKIEASTEDSFQELVNDHFDIISVIGASGLVRSFATKEKLLDCIITYDRLKLPRDARQQFTEGLKLLGTFKAAKRFPKQFHSVFVHNEQILSAEDLRDLFKVTYSEAGSNRLRKEEQIYSWFNDTLLDVQEKEDNHEVTLEEILIFATGYDVIPLAGFPFKPTLLFDHDKTGYEAGWLWASTCSLELTLPTSHSSYESFKTTILACVKNTKVFDAR